MEVIPEASSFHSKRRGPGMSTANSHSSQISCWHGLCGSSNRGPATVFWLVTGSTHGGLRCRPVGKINNCNSHCTAEQHERPAPSLATRNSKVSSPCIPVYVCSCPSSGKVDGPYGKIPDCLLCLCYYRKPPPHSQSPQFVSWVLQNPYPDLTRCQSDSHNRPNAEAIRSTLPLLGQVFERQLNVDNERYPGAQTPLLPTNPAWCLFTTAVVYSFESKTMHCLEQLSENYALCR